MKKKFIIRYLTIIMVLMSFNSTALYAGWMEVKCDTGTTVTIFVEYSNNSSNVVVTDDDNDGKVRYYNPNQHLIKRIHVAKKENGKDLFYEIIIQVAGPTLLALEPVYIPVFEAIMPGYKLINVIDIATLVGEGTLFNINQILPVTNGVLPQTNAIVFKDASAYPDSILMQYLTPAFINNLPNYNGDVRVLVPDKCLPPDAYPIPTLSEWGLIIFGIILLAVGAIFIIKRRKHTLGLNS